MASFSQIKKGKRYHLKTLGHGLQEIKIQVCAWYSKYDLACLVAIVMVFYLEEGDPILTNIDNDHAVLPIASTSHNIRVNM